MESEDFCWLRTFLETPLTREGNKHLDFQTLRGLRKSLRETIHKRSKPFGRHLLRNGGWQPARSGPVAAGIRTRATALSFLWWRYVIMPERSNPSAVMRVLKQVVEIHSLRVT